MMRATNLPGIGLALVFVAFPTARAADAPLQELTKVSALEGVTAARWAGNAEGYTLSVILDNAALREKQRALAAANTASNPPPPPPQQQPPPPVLPPGEADRAAFFIGNTIENLRGLDPDLSCRMLTLIDGRRPGRLSQQPASLPPAQRDGRVQVWLLKSDGTQLLPASYHCAKQGDLVHITYAFDAADIAAIDAAAVRVNRDYIIEPLRPLATAAAAP